MIKSYNNGTYFEVEINVISNSISTKITKIWDINKNILSALPNGVKLDNKSCFTLCGCTYICHPCKGWLTENGDCWQTSSGLSWLTV